MGAQESTLSGFDGFQVVRVSEGSPAHRAGLVPFFDFICAVDDLVIMQDNNRFFFDYVSRNVDKPVRFRVFNLRVRAEREVVMTPSAWGGKGLLGCNVNWNSPQAALESTWHITDVAPGSPAFAAGIVGMRDYLIGMQAPEGVGIALFRDNGDFHARLEQWRITANASASAKLLLLLYDAANDEVREAVLDFSANGGRRVADVSLGVEVANGYLHVVPLAPGSPNVPKVGQLVASASAPATPMSEAPAAAAAPIAGAATTSTFAAGAAAALTAVPVPVVPPAAAALQASSTEVTAVLAAPPLAPAPVAAPPATFPAPPQPVGPANGGLAAAPFALPPFPMPAGFPAPPFAPIASS